MEEQFDKAKDYVAQEEVGDSGTPHVQGVIRYKVQKDLAKMKLELKRAHLEICRDWDASKEYCSKEDTRAEGGRFWSAATSWAAELYDPMVGHTLYPWQRHLRDKMKNSKKNEDRLIYWYWEDVGKVGKSALARHICITNPRALYVYGKTADICCLLALKKEESGGKMKNMPNLLIYDCPRTGNINYHALEMIKNGIFMSGKYKSEQIMMNPPFIVVFSNSPPKTTELSRDRLKVYKIENKHAIKDEMWDKITIVRCDAATDWFD